MMARDLFLFLVVAVAVLGSSTATTKVFNLTITRKQLTIAGVTRQTVVVNDQFPGPEIRVSRGDRVIVNVVNALPMRPISIHYHGIWQRGTPWQDGPEMISQCPIPPRTSYQYDFQVAPQVGTFWYHGHDAFSKVAGLLGPLIVDDPANPLVYDSEMTLIISDFYHTTGEQRMNSVLNVPFIWVGDPQAIIFNGAADTVLTVEAGKTYRLRLLNTASLSYLNFAIAGHNVTVVEVDGTYCDPLPLSSLDINIGQRYSVLFTADQPVGNYWINAQTMFRNTVAGQATLRYVGAPAALPTGPLPTQGTLPPTKLAFTDKASFTAAVDATVAPREAMQAQLHSTAAEVSHYPPPAAFTRSITVVGTQQRMSDGGSRSYTPFALSPSQAYSFPTGPNKDKRLYWPLNGSAQILTHTPLLASVYYGLDRSKPSVVPNNVHSIQQGEIIQVVLQNTYALSGTVSEQHPWHLHGHSFWLLGQGRGIYDPATHEAGLNTVNPIYRDALTLYPLGWAVIRFKADNPGVWLMHCHVDYHLAMGMALAFVESRDSIPPPPANAARCGQLLAAAAANATAAVTTTLEDERQALTVGVVTLSVLLALALVGLLLLALMLRRLSTSGPQQQQQQQPVVRSIQMAEPVTTAAAAAAAGAGEGDGEGAEAAAPAAAT